MPLDNVSQQHATWGYSPTLLLQPTSFLPAYAPSAPESTTSCLASRTLYLLGTLHSLVLFSSAIHCCRISGKVASVYSLSLEEVTQTWLLKLLYHCAINFLNPLYQFLLGSFSPLSHQSSNTSVCNNVLEWVYWISCSYTCYNFYAVHLYIHRQIWKMIQVSGASRRRPTIPVSATSRRSLRRRSVNRLQYHHQVIRSQKLNLTLRSIKISRSNHPDWEISGEKSDVP